MAQGIAGECGQLLTIPMYVDTAWTTCIVGDYCMLDTNHNTTVCDNGDDAVPFGRIIALSPGTNATTIALGDVVATVEVYHFRGVRAMTQAGAIAVGAGAMSKDNAVNTVESDTWAGCHPKCIHQETSATGYFLV
jgi:hypothetical protein